MSSDTLYQDVLRMAQASIGISATLSCAYFAFYSFGKTERGRASGHFVGLRSVILWLCVLQSAKQCFVFSDLGKMLLGGHPVLSAITRLVSAFFTVAFYTSLILWFAKVWYRESMFHSPRDSDRQSCFSKVQEFMENIAQPIQDHPFKFYFSILFIFAIILFLPSLIFRFAFENEFWYMQYLFGVQIVASAAIIALGAFFLTAVAFRLNELHMDPTLLEFVRRARHGATALSVTATGNLILCTLKAGGVPWMSKYFVTPFDDGVDINLVTLIFYVIFEALPPLVVVYCFRPMSQNAKNKLHLFPGGHAPRTPSFHTLIDEEPISSRSQSSTPAFFSDNSAVTSPLVINSDPTAQVIPAGTPIIPLDFGGLVLPPEDEEEEFEDDIFVSFSYVSQTIQDERSPFARASVV